ncbi:unnamed protein product [Caenorhabditis brenneri]
MFVSMQYENDSTMAELDKSLTLFNIFIYIVLCFLVLIAVFYTCKYYIRRLELFQYAIFVQPDAEHVGKKTEQTDVESGPPTPNSPIPQITITMDYLPPEYSELDIHRASPLPTYSEATIIDYLPN